MKKHQNRFLFSKEEADYYISQLNKSGFNSTDYESKLLILNLLLTSKQVRHYGQYKRNFNLVYCKSQPIVFRIKYAIDEIKFNSGHYSVDLFNIVDWIRVHTIRKKGNLSGPTR